ncbi:hypothetical protein C6P82_22380 [Burkholderia multivorans]|nr:hypothetical protein C6P82_22380 [Burkholderia multivorans]
MQRHETNLDPVSQPLNLRWRSKIIHHTCFGFSNVGIKNPFNPLYNRKVTHIQTSVFEFTFEILTENVLIHNRNPLGWNTNMGRRADDDKWYNFEVLVELYPEPRDISYEFTPVIRQGL